MPEFRDNLGRVWNVHVACAEVEAVRKTLAIDLLDPKEFGRVVMDPAVSASVLVHCCQLAAAGVDRASFMGAIWGDVVDDARQALADAVIRFFPGRARREAMTRAMTEFFAETTREAQQSDGAGSSASAQESSE